MKIEKYNRASALSYAREYALKRNPAYYDFSSLGGDCTNFCSQCIYAGSNQMNYTKEIGWYYNSANDRAPAWSGVNQLYAFLTNNIVINKIGEGYGPFAEVKELSELSIGDVIFLGRTPDLYYHAVVVVGFDGPIPLVASHSYDVYAKPINAYDYNYAKGLHILGVRK